MSNKEGASRHLFRASDNPRIYSGPIFLPGIACQYIHPVSGLQKIRKARILIYEDGHSPHAGRYRVSQGVSLGIRFADADKAVTDDLFPGIHIAGHDHANGAFRIHNIIFQTHGAACVKLQGLFSRNRGGKAREDPGIRGHRDGDLLLHRTRYYGRRLSSNSASRRTPLPLAKPSHYWETSRLSPCRTCAHRPHCTQCLSSGNEAGHFPSQKKFIIASLKKELSRYQKSA